MPKYRVMIGGYICECVSDEYIVSADSELEAEDQAIDRFYLEHNADDIDDVYTEEVDEEEEE